MTPLPTDLRDFALLKSLSYAITDASINSTQLYLLAVIHATPGITMGEINHHSPRQIAQTTLNALIERGEIATCPIHAACTARLTSNTKHGYRLEPAGLKVLRTIAQTTFDQINPSKVA